MKTETTNQPQTLQGTEEQPYQIALYQHNIYIKRMGFKYPSKVQNSILVTNSELAETITALMDASSTTTLLKENNQFKEQVKLLKEALVNLGEMCEWIPKDTFTNDGQIKFQNALAQATEALNQTK